MALHSHFATKLHIPSSLEPLAPEYPWLGWTVPGAPDPTNPDPNIAPPPYIQVTIAGQSMYLYSEYVHSYVQNFSTEADAIQFAQQVEPMLPFFYYLEFVPVHAHS